ncbi:MAG: HAMP domain-containing histidine kinase [Sedimentisphaerales bacterium]|nr:HAMP domain-containing histidine kinase [Sedimentisphaerales bacterium]
MYKRLIILSIIILAALCGLAWLGYHSIRIREQGLQGARLGEFAAVAEQIRQDVTRTLDEFMKTEQNRPYTDYQYYFVPENVAPNQQSTGWPSPQLPVLRSPLAGRLEQGLAYGNFQIEPDGSVITPNDNVDQIQDLNDSDNELYAEALLNRQNIRDNLLPALRGTTPGSLKMNLYNRNNISPPKEPATIEPEQFAKETTQKGKLSQNYPIESLQSKGQKAQVLRQRRDVVEQNIISNVPAQPQQQIQQAQTQSEQAADQLQQQALPAIEGQTETVQVRIEPFFPVVVPGKFNVGDTASQPEESVFGGQVFLLRYVQIEDRHFLQGFQLNEKKLIEQIEESASRFVRKGMSFDLSQGNTAGYNEDAAYAAILNFGFGDLVLNLKEIDPGWIGREIHRLRLWYFGIVAIVFAAVTLGLASLWQNVAAQIRLAQKKDDFISAVSHELRTPLTSIRMYAEMLEKNWVKSPDKAVEYYSNLRQESERLSRLIENVLDFSRIQKGRKKYAFNAGDINKCVSDVVEMMRPYAVLKGFSIQTEPGQIEQATFDADAVTQIVVNLLDNAIKYARDAEDKTIIVRTKTEGNYTVIEVEDHGPGVPHRQRNKIFEQFYRPAAEATRETTGTGLGLALVKRFAEAHNGFVEIVSAKPTGAIFKVALATRI